MPSRNPSVLQQPTRRQAAFAVVFGVLAWSNAVQACNVPVFRFALERWRPDPYRVMLFHRGPLGDAEQQLIRPLEEQQAKSAANVTFRTVDVNSLDNAKDREFFASQESPQLPWLVARYPEHLNIDTPAWKGTCDREAIACLSDSPLRQELVKRLVDGETAVWLFLDCGQPEIDDPAAVRVSEELKKLEKELMLPELTESPDDALLSNSPLRIAFSMLRVPRGNNVEQALVEMLLHSESDLASRSDPLVFPIFGRGRSLFPLVGAGITPENIRESASFLVGPCSCQVKELNPGFDLLLSANWDSLLSLEGISLTAVASNQRVPTGDPELVPIPSGSGGSAPADPTVVSRVTDPAKTGLDAEAAPAATSPAPAMTGSTPSVLSQETFTVPTKTVVGFPVGMTVLGIGLTGGLLLVGILVAVILAQRR